MKMIIVLTVVCSMATLIHAGVPLARFESLINQQSVDLGLYNSSDKVNILTDTNFDENVHKQHRSVLVEFYNSYCGHCKRFASSYKQLANEIYSWRDILLVCAVDCADDSNNGLCREYEVMHYPTLRYMSPGFAPSANNYGKEIKTLEVKEIKEQLALWVSEENRTQVTSAWPNFQAVNANESRNLYENQPNEIQLVVLIYETENTTIGYQTILHFSRYSNVMVRRITDTKIATKFNMDNHKTKVASIDRNGIITPHTVQSESPESYIEAIQNIIKKQNLEEKSSEYVVIKRNATSLNINTKTEQSDEILKGVMKSKHTVYQADLEMAVRGLLFVEIPRMRDISGERLLAVQRLLNILNRYNPLGANGRKFVKQLYEYVHKFNQDLTGMIYESELKQLEKANAPIFSSTHYVGCAASQATLRGFTCSLWQLFHYFTVQSSQNDTYQDPLEVLQAIHGYVKYFFGCTECAEHFQDMAKRRKIWSVPNKDEAILWLWAAHNEVNKRLAGDPTEDPKFPKIQFPSEDSCPSCFKHPTTTHPNLEINWDKDAVLNFLKTIHETANISRFGVINEEVLHPRADKMRQKRMILNVFSDIDMRMGMLLYGLCIVMMVLAFKLFVFKGYRKKPYSHDLLGKV